MPVIDVASLTTGIAADAPCGPDLEYSADYVALLQLMRGTPDVEYGDMRQAAADPDWKAVKAAALALLGQTRDLRLVVWLTRALTALHGWAGLDDGLALAESYIEQYWADVHPRLDADDDDDPTERVNALSALQDKDGLLRQVYTLALAESPMHGSASLRILDIAAGELPPATDESAPDASAIDAIFKTASLQGLKDTAAQLTQAAARVERIEAMVTEHVGHARSVALRELRAHLRRAGDTVRGRLASHPEWRSTDAALDGVAPDEGATGLSAAGQPAPNGVPQSRDDVIAMIDRICDYYADNEPASPIPLLLQRVRRLVGLPFIEILNDLSPDSVAQINHIAGIAA